MSAAPASAEGSGYGGGAGQLKARWITGPKGSAAEPERWLEVQGSGFLAESEVRLRVDDGSAVVARADGLGRLVVEIPAPRGRAAWVSATGSDASFQRRVLTARTPETAAGALVTAPRFLGALGAVLAASALVGPLRTRRAAHRSHGHGLVPPPIGV